MSVGSRTGSRLRPRRLAAGLRRRRTAPGRVRASAVSSPRSRRRRGWGRVACRSVAAVRRGGVPAGGGGGGGGEEGLARGGGGGWGGAHRNPPPPLEAPHGPPRCPIRWSARRAGRCPLGLPRRGRI